MTHRGRYKMAAILQTTFRSTFSSMKKSIEIYSSESKCQYVSIGSDNDLAPNRRKAIIWTSVGLVQWRIYALPGLNEL